MLCIASFIVFLILGIFSATHRKLAAKAWYCFTRKITFKPCDINFNEELKSKLLGKLIFTKPRLAKHLDRWIEVLAFLFIVLSIWSLFAVTLSTMNLWVYDTCDPQKGESCSLGGEACGIGTGALSFTESLSQGKIVDWAMNHITTFGETVSRIPDRFKEWAPEDYTTSTSTFYLPFDDTKKVALEIVDPGCIYCARLMRNIKKAKFYEDYNVTYLAYPIPDPTSANGYKFPHSFLIAKYLEAVKDFPLTSIEVPSDWQLLEKIYTEKDDNDVEWQFLFNNVYDEDAALERIHAFLSEIGYPEETIAVIDEHANSDLVLERMNRNKDIVENKVRTIKIPTIMFDGRRYDRLVSVEQLQ